MKSRIFLIAASVLTVAVSAFAQVDPALYSDMRWREIGPMRAGRTRALAGVPSEPATFYLGAVNGGVWKTTDAGATWHSIWDDEPTGSIGSIAVSLSDPDIVYVGSGEGLQRPDLSTGDGVYKSTDAGKTWTHLEGLRDGQQIGQTRHRPQRSQPRLRRCRRPPLRPERRARPLSHHSMAEKPSSASSSPTTAPAHPRSRSIRKHPNIVFAGMWQRQEAPWENGSFGGAEGGLYRSTDGGDTWTKLTGNGLPDDILQVKLTISPSDPRRIYGAIAHHCTAPVGLYRSDDGGDQLGARAGRRYSRPKNASAAAMFPSRSVDPKDPDTIYVASIVTWKSTDAGKTWTALRGSPGGDDYQNVFVNPNNTKIIALASDQGVIISQNGGETWTQWYQPGHRADVSRNRRQRVSLSRLRRPAGLRLRVRLQPQRRWPHHLSRLASSRHRRVRLRGPRSARSRHRLRRQSNALRSPHRPDSRRRAQAAAQLSRRCAPSRCSFRPSIRTSFTSPPTRSGSPRTAASTGRRSAPTSRRETWELPPVVEPYKDSPAAKIDAPRRHLCARPFAARRQPHLGRHRRRPHLDHHRRRRALEQRHSAGAEALLEGLQHGRRPLRRADRLRGRQHPAPRRHASASLPHARRRQNLDRDRQRHSRRRGHQRHPRRSQAQRAALRRHRDPGLCLLRRRRSLAIASSQHARKLRPRSRSERRRPDRRDSRPRLPDPRRRNAAAPDCSNHRHRRMLISTRRRPHSASATT